MSGIVEMTQEHFRRLSAQLAHDLASWLERRGVEPHYSVGTLAGLLEVSERTVWTWVDNYERSSGREGLGPVLKLSHKVVRVPASSVQRFLDAKRITIAAGSAPERGAA